MRDANQYLGGMILHFSAIVFDIDGTLLDSQGRLSQANALALRECFRRNIVLYVATAVPVKFAGNKLADVPFLMDRGVFYNGALAMDSSLGYSRHWTLPAGLVYSLSRAILWILLLISRS